jgi:hypothetical protein
MDRKPLAPEKQYTRTKDVGHLSEEEQGTSVGQREDREWPLQVRLRLIVRKMVEGVLREHPPR